MESYDPLETPVSEEWLALDESEQQHLVETYHLESGEELPNLTLHASIHAAVENQLAMEIGAVRDALDRLLGDGLDRHEAIHAVGSVLAEHLYELMQSPSSESGGEDSYYKALERLTVASWRGAS